jgi:hypothetical protein
MIYVPKVLEVLPIFKPLYLIYKGQCEKETEEMMKHVVNKTNPTEISVSDVKDEQIVAFTTECPRRFCVLSKSPGDNVWFWPDVRCFNGYEQTFNTKSLAIVTRLDAHNEVFTFDSYAEFAQWMSKVINEGDE